MAAAQASGIREIYGSDAKALQPGRAAMDGVLSALMAERGMTARDTALEGERDLLSVISRAPQPEILVESQGEQWAVLSNGHKLYPNASLLHPAIDAAIALTKHPGFARDTVVFVEVRMLPFAASVTGMKHPGPGSEARFSAAHCVAFALQAGYLGLDSFSAAAVGDPEVARMRDLVTVLGEPEVGKRGARMTSILRDGTTLEHVVHANRGTRTTRCRMTIWTPNCARLRCRASAFPVPTSCWRGVGIWTSPHGPATSSGRPGRGLSHFSITGLVAQAPQRSAQRCLAGRL
jgi:2-methylcitrate dehydratase PrpD